jgi:hypothetical protein
MARCAQRVTLPVPVDRDSSLLAAIIDSPPAPPPAATAGPCRPAPDAFRVNTPAIATPLHTLLKVVAIVNGDDPQTRQLLDHVAVEQYQIEVNDRFDRDVSEDAEAGASVLGLAGDVRWRRGSR